MKFKKSAKKNGSLIVELEAGNTRLLSAINGPITALKEVLVPIDFSDCSKHALRYAAAFPGNLKRESHCSRSCMTRALFSNWAIPNTSIN